MAKLSSLKGKTLFITGSSRGIGLAIGKEAAKDGANVVIIAKTTEPHPKLEGTIFTAAEEIEAAGGKAQRGRFGAQILLKRRGVNQSAVAPVHACRLPAPGWQPKRKLP